MTITDKIYNFYNGLFGKTVSEMLDDPRIDKFFEDGIKREYASFPRRTSAEIEKSLSHIAFDPIPAPVHPVRQVDEKEYARIKLDYVYYEIKNLEKTISNINREARKLVEIGVPYVLHTEQWLKPEECPLEILNRHMELSQILVGVGCWAWNCPFCNKRFEE